jgi:hypothetical protein
MSRKSKYHEADPVYFEDDLKKRTQNIPSTILSMAQLVALGMIRMKRSLTSMAALLGSSCSS